MFDHMLHPITHRREARHASGTGPAATCSTPSAPLALRGRSGALWGMGLLALLFTLSACSATDSDLRSSATDEISPSGTLGGSADSSERERTTSETASTSSVTGAGTTSGSASSSRTEAVTSEPSSSSEPEVRSCRNNRECRGGELCEGGVCRAVCAPDIACEDDALPVCDEEAGFCVRCLVDEECTEGRRCTEERSCARACEADDECGTGRVCETDRGYCVARQCQVNTDCAGGFFCAGGRCIDLESRICVPESGSCDDNELTQCNRYGTQERVEGCGTEALCIEDEGRAACHPIICDANTQRCADDGTLAICDETGTSEQESPCSAEEVCDQERCRRVVCEAGTITCEGNSVRVCNDAGTNAVLDPCNERVSCQATPFGCACEAGECETRVCEPGRSRCVEGNPFRCSEDGLDEVALLACDSDQICFGGECLDASCGEGQRQCAGDVLLVCEIGEFVEERDCAAEARFCQGTVEGALCQDRICTPGSRTCDGNTVEVCDSRGASVSREPCDEGTFCSEGICRDQICEPDALICANTIQVARCNDQGSESTVIQTCILFEETCLDGACACLQGLERCEGQCTNTNVSTSHCGGCNQACTEGRVCRDGACRCPQGLTDCSGRCVDLQTNSNTCGSCSNRCADDEVCSGGECVSQTCSCLDSETYCDPANCNDDIAGSEFGCCSTFGCGTAALFPPLPCLEFDPNYDGGEGSAP